MLVFIILTKNLENICKELNNYDSVFNSTVIISSNEHKILESEALHAYLSDNVVKLSKNLLQIYYNSRKIADAYLTVYNINNTKLFNNNILLKNINNAKINIYVDNDNNFFDDSIYNYIRNILAILSALTSINSNSSILAHYKNVYAIATSFHELNAENAFYVKFYRTSYVNSSSDLKIYQIIDYDIFNDAFNVSKYYASYNTLLDALRKLNTNFNITLSDVMYKHNTLASTFVSIHDDDIINYAYEYNLKRLEAK